MATSTFFIFLALLTLVIGNPFPKPSSTKLNSRIVAGQTSQKGQFPYQVSLQSQENGHFCGGSVLNKKWILTAAHCTWRTKLHFYVVVGVSDLKNLESEGTKHEVSKVIVHPEFNPNLIRNDVSLIRLQESIIFSENVKNILLPHSNMNINGLTVIASGWGRLTAGGKRPTKLQYLRTQIYDHNSCVKRMAELPSMLPVTKNNICTFTKSGEGLCNGDSGGPVVINNLQIGITSFGFPCARGYPDILVNVWSYVDWIKNHITEQ